MKNMKVSKKLITSFLIVAFFAITVGLTGIVGMIQMDTASSEMYDMETEPLSHMSKIIETLQRMRVNMREYVIGAFHGDMDQVETAHTAIEEYKKTMAENLDYYKATIIDPEAKTLFDEARTLYDTSFKDCLQKTYDLAKTGSGEAVYTELVNYTSDANKIVANFDRCMILKTHAASVANDDIDSLYRMLLILIICVLVFAVSIAIFMAFYISGLISKPLVSMAGTFDLIGTKGVLELDPEEAKYAQEVVKRKDELGTCAKAAVGLINHLTRVGEILEHISEGDLTVNVNLLSERDKIGIVLKKMTDSLNEMFSDINASSSQVTIGSEQVAEGSQSLAQGSTEQASSVEELSVSISEISEKTKESAKMADEAACLSADIKDNAESGNHKMDQLMQAVTEINNASQNISKVIKVIDDIAFQTNILALNAAVEAARAGQHGKGFAVVAEEVRNLASKSAEAAKDTNGMIENSIEKSNFGLNIANETSESLKEIVDGINRSAEIVAQIAQSSDEQAVAISQINIGIDQVSQVIQQNSATAEESAAASEEMSGQASLLQELIRRFKLRNEQSDNSFEPSPPSSRKQLAVGSNPSFAQSDFGKY